MISRIKEFLWKKWERIFVGICAAILLPIIMNAHIYIVSDPLHLETTSIVFIIFPEFVILVIAELVALGTLCYTFLGYIPFINKAS